MGKSEVMLPYHVKPASQDTLLKKTTHVLAESQMSYLNQIQADS